MLQCHTSANSAATILFSVYAALQKSWPEDLGHHWEMMKKTWAGNNDISFVTLSVRCIPNHYCCLPLYLSYIEAA